MGVLVKCRSQVNRIDELEILLLELLFFLLVASISEEWDISLVASTFHFCSRDFGFILQKSALMTGDLNHVCIQILVTVTVITVVAFTLFIICILPFSIHSQSRFFRLLDENCTKSYFLIQDTAAALLRLDWTKASIPTPHTLENYKNHDIIRRRRSLCHVWDNQRRHQTPSDSGE